jgi:hypothetical protein
MLLALAGCLILTSSCHKYIYQAPINAPYGATFWTSQVNVEQAASDMYGQLRICLRNSNSFFINGDLTTGTFNPASAQWNLASMTASYNPPFDFSYVPYFEPDLQNWSRFYVLIAQANLMLENVPAMPATDFQSEAVRSRYLAEALFIRAYAYFYMIRIWGDPVYVTKVYNDVDFGKIPPVARTAEGLVLDSCLMDLRSAALNLSYAAGDPTKSVRASKGGAYALMAHIFAWKHQYDSAHAYCQQVIQNGGYSLEPMSTYKNIWNGQSSLESIFELAMTYNQNDPNFQDQNAWAEAQFGFFEQWLKGPLTGNQSTDCWISPSGGLVDNTLFTDTTDARYKTVLQLMPASGNDVAGYMLLKYTNFAFQNPTTESYPYYNNDLVLFRLSDMYLLDAEALAYKGDLAGASQDLSMTEGRAGITSYQGITDAYDMVDEVVMERGREFIGEGSWYYDLIRTDSTQGWLEYVGYPSDRVTPANKGYYWPLDLTTLFPQDNLLTQNPYWAVHK